MQQIAVVCQVIFLFCFGTSLLLDAAPISVPVHAALRFSLFFSISHIGFLIVNSINFPSLTLHKQLGFAILDIFTLQTPGGECAALDWQGAADVLCVSASIFWCLPCWKIAMRSSMLSVVFAKTKKPNPWWLLTVKKPSFTHWDDRYYTAVDPYKSHS